MNKRLIPIAIVIILVVAASALTLSGKQQGVTVENPYARYTGFAAGVFFKLVNNGDREACIVKAYTKEPASVKVELHKSEQVGNRHVMRPVEKICAPPNGVAELRPGGYHVMIMGEPEELKKLVDDGAIDLVLVIDTGAGVEEVEVKAPVKG